MRGLNRGISANQRPVFRSRDHPRPIRTEIENMSTIKGRTKQPLSQQIQNEISNKYRTVKVEKFNNSNKYCEILVSCSVSSWNCTNDEGSLNAWETACMSLACFYIELHANFQYFESLVVENCTGKVEFQCST